MRVSTFVKRTVQDYIDRHRVVVWYDGEGVFGSFVTRLELRDCAIVLATDSRLDARRRADEAFLDICDRGAEAPGLLVYVSQTWGVTEAERVADMFECFAVAGTAFGDQESEQVQSLARQAMPKAEAQIDRLFKEGKPTLRVLDGLEKSSGYPLLKQALGTESPVDVGALLIADGTVRERIAVVEGAQADLERLLQTEFGFAIAEGLDEEALAPSFARYALLSELVSALSDETHEGLEGHELASGDHVEAAVEACARARGQSALRDGYMRRADEVELDVGVEPMLPTGSCPWMVDTFRCQDGAALRVAASCLESGDVPAASAIAAGRRDSVWLSDAERALIWRVLERCVDFFTLATDLEKQLPGSKATPQQWLTAYCDDSGLWRLDRLQRLLEQSYAECVSTAALDTAVEAARVTYRTAAEQMQADFLPAVAEHGWPPQEATRATQCYERGVITPVSEGQRVAYFLVDALRYEMARDLAEGLKSLGEIELTPVASSLPTTTPVGMAALMPAADGALSLEDVAGEAIPVIGSQRLAGSADRMSYLKTLLGDRFEDVTLNDLLSMTEKKATARFTGREILVVRTQDIDELGEGANLLLARQMMSAVLSHLRKATDLLAGLGFTRFVFVADHGHVLLPEIPPGDVVTAPSGDWLLAKRRCRLGNAHTTASGTLALRPADVGIVTTARDFVVPSGMRVFTAGGGYFHEGISLQECVLPLLVLKAGAKGQAAGQRDVHLSYKSDRFTGRVIGVRITYLNLLEPQLHVRVEAFSGPGNKATIVGHAADCPALESATGLVHLANGEDTQVPVLIDNDFAGDVLEIRVIDPATGRTLDALSLQNDMLD